VCVLDGFRLGWKGNQFTIVQITREKTGVLAHIFPEWPMVQQHLFICRKGGKHEATSRFIIMVILVQCLCIKTCMVWLVMIYHNLFSW